MNNMRRNTSLLALAALLSTIGCASTSGKGGSGATGKSATTPSSFALRRPVVFNSSVCLADRSLIEKGRAKESLATILIGAIAPKLIDVAVTKAATALNNAAAAKVDTVAAKTGAYYYVYDREADAKEGTVTLVGNCIEFIILDDSKSWTDFKTAMQAIKIDKGEIDGLRKALGLGIDDDKPGPAFFYEAAIIPSTDISAIQVRPAVLFYPESLATAKKGEARTLTAVYTFKDIAGTAIATADITLPKVKIGDPAAVGPLTIRHVQSPWLPVVPLSDATKEKIADEQTKDPPISRIQEKLTPFNLEVSVSETREARQWLQAIADVLGSDEVKTAAKGALTDALVPKSPDKEEEEAISAATAAKDLELAKRDVALACIKRAAATGAEDIATADRDIVEKQYAANEKAIKAGKPKPYPDPNTPKCQ